MTEPAGPARQGISLGLTNYGDPDFALYLRRSFARSMGYSLDMLAKPVIGIADTRSGFNNCHRHFPELIDAVKRGVLAAGGLPLVFPTISLGEVFLNPTSLMFRNLMAMDTEEMIRAQPMDAVVLVGRLRQDRAGAADGRGVGQPAGDRAGRRADDDVALARRAARRLHRLPPLLGEVPRRRGDHGRDRRGRGQSRDDSRHLRGDGHGEHDGLDRRGARHDPAGQRRDPGGARRPAARRRGDRTRRDAARRREDHARPHRDAGIGRECAARSDGDRRLDQCGAAPDGGRRARRRRYRSEASQRDQRFDPGPGRSEADRAALHGGSVRGGRHRRGAARTEAAAQPRLPDGGRRDPRRAAGGAVRAGRSRRGAAAGRTVAAGRRPGGAVRIAGAEAARSSSAPPPTRSCSRRRGAPSSSPRSKICRRGSTTPIST